MDEETRTATSKRRAGSCVKHDDLAWLYDDGSVSCMYALVVETSSADCVWDSMPAYWRHDGQDTGLRNGRSYYCKRCDGVMPAGWPYAVCEGCEMGSENGRPDDA